MRSSVISEDADGGFCGILRSVGDETLGLAWCLPVQPPMYWSSLWEFILRCEVLEREGGRARGRDNRRESEGLSLHPPHNLYRCVK